MVPASHGPEQLITAKNQSNEANKEFNTGKEIEAMKVAFVELFIFKGILLTVRNEKMLFPQFFFFE
jgi:hypothetical protein